MSYLLIITIGLFLIILYYIIVRKRIKAKQHNYLSNRVFNLKNDLESTFKNSYITDSQAKIFANKYNDRYNEAIKLITQSERFRIEVSEIILKNIRDFENIYDLIKWHNKIFLQQLLDRYSEYFDHCLEYPLDRQQRRSIVSEEENCLVISSAGSGKTSSIMGKVKYLTEIKKVDPQKILLISYTNKAAAELTERVGIPGLKGYTFHKLAIDIIGQTTGEKPSICDNTDVLFIKIYRELKNNKEFKRNVIKYYRDYQFQDSQQERFMAEKRQKLSEEKLYRIKALLPDMDGHTIYVRSEQERKICYELSSLGVKFRYEEPYEHNLADETHSQYRPDFSIWYDSHGKTKRIYLEHFGVNEQGLVPIWFAKDKNLSYEEANKRYNDGITWKIEAHKKFNTKLLVTSSSDFYNSTIRETLKKQLIAAGVSVCEQTDDQLLAMVSPPNSKQEKAFIRLIATFVTLLKSSCRSVSDIIYAVNAADDERGQFIINNIFLPVYNLYQQELQSRNQKDFTDIILQATKICKTKHPISYDYIIVDEFQDISLDRYEFLQALRTSSKPAKLYCVGDDWQSIYRFSGSDISLFNRFSDYFGATDICKIETTYRFGQPLVNLSSQFITRNTMQIKKDIHPFNPIAKTELRFYSYNRSNYCLTIETLLSYIPAQKSILLLGRYSFDDIYLSSKYKSVKEGNKFFYIINNRKVEFITAHKSKGLEADFVILLQCNRDTYGFPSQINDDPVLNYVLTENDEYPYSEERRLFYVAITRAKEKTFILYNERCPSVFVDEFLHPEKLKETSYLKHPNANKKWTAKADSFLLKLYNEGKSVKYISAKMGRSQTSIIMRLGKLNGNT